MSISKRKIFSASKAQILPRLSNATNVALAEVSREGLVLEINSLGKKLLGWKVNDRLSAPITSAIKTLDATPMRLPIGRGGVYVVGVSKGPGKGCLLFGFDLDDSAKSSPFNTIVDEIPVAITRSNKSGVVKFANRYARKFLGRDPVGHSLWHEVILDCDQWKLDHAIEQLSKIGHASTRIRYTDVDGKIRNAILYLYRSEDEASDGYVDIAGFDTEDEFAARSADPVSASVASEAMYKAFVEQSPVGIVMLDPKGIIVMENHPLRQITGEGPEDALIGNHYTQVTNLSDEFIETVSAMLDDGVPFSVDDVEFISKTGEYVLSLKGSPIVQEDGDVSGGVILIEDRTSQKKAEQIIEAAKDEAIESSARKAAFIATMSHELRTPLGAINGFSKLLLQEIADMSRAGKEIPDVFSEFASVIQERSSEVLVLVDDLFDLALIDSGMLVLDRAPINLAATVDEVIQEVRPKFEAKGLELVLRVDGKPAGIECDAKRIRQVLRILLDNALKFTEHGRVSVTVGETMDSAFIQISDTGIGIEEDAIDDIFKPLVQADDGVNRDYEGAGVGLAMVDRVVKLMGGSISAESRIERGSRFTITLLKT